LASNLSQADIQTGLDAYDRGDYATALREFQAAAMQGSADAQFVIGVMYANGQGVPQDYAQAAMWYRKAAEQGDAHAQFLLGLLYAKGLGVPQDYALAVALLSKAAEQGIYEAREELKNISSNALPQPGSVRGVHRCADAAGEVTFTDHPCSTDTVAKQSIALSPPAPEPVRAQKQYTGERLTVNFQDLEIRAFLKLMSTFVGIPFVVSDRVQGKITVEYKNMPWDEVLDRMLASQGLMAKHINGKIYIAGQNEL
jgi:TPR repeat protein